MCSHAASSSHAIVLHNRAYVDCGNIDAAVWLVRLSRAEAGVEAQQAGTYHKIFGALTQAEAEAIPVAKVRGKDTNIVQHSRHTHQ